jgi:hypothetical protein
VRLKIPKPAGATFRAYGALATPLTVTVSETSPRGAFAGSRASMRRGETASNGARTEAPRADTITEVVRALVPRRIPVISNSAPRATAPPGSTDGVRLAALTTPPVRMAGGCAHSAAAASKTAAT